MGIREFFRGPQPIQEVKVVKPIIETEALAKVDPYEKRKQEYERVRAEENKKMEREFKEIANPLSSLISLARVRVTEGNFDEEDSDLVQTAYFAHQKNSRFLYQVRDHFGIFRYGQHGENDGTAHGTSIMIDALYHTDEGREETFLFLPRDPAAITFEWWRKKLFDNSLRPFRELGKEGVQKLAHELAFAQKINKVTYEETRSIWEMNLEETRFNN